MDYKQLSNIYNHEIRNKCKNNNLALEKCFKNHFNDEFCCQEEIKEFSKCIDDFNRRFFKKYKIKEKLIK
tara:strand:- start:1728 stop:1937 length:210 start_codon:yes stop_codon:yes gene_type:complete